MARLLGLPEHTLFAELIERSLDAMFDEQFPENGTFVERSVTNRDGASRRYWYYQGYRPGTQANETPKRYGRYVGLADDPMIAERVARFRDLKHARGERAQLVDALIGAGMPRPPVLMGKVVEALAKAGVFRLRAVLVGTVAYQTFGGIIGAMPSQAAAMTGDVDVAQFRSVSIGVEDSVSDMHEVLRTVDPSFRMVPGLTTGSKATVFVNGAGFRVDFLTPHRGSDEQMGAPLTLPALGGVSAQPLRFMDFLIRNPVRSVVLHGPGVPVAVPAPERFAVHKLIVSGRRSQDGAGIAKSRKDIVQAGEVIEALALADRLHLLAPALTEAWGRGPEWQRLVARGAAKLKPAARAILEELGCSFALWPPTTNSTDEVSDPSP